MKAIKLLLLLFVDLNAARLTYHQPQALVELVDEDCI